MNDFINFVCAFIMNHAKVVSNCTIKKSTKEVYIMGAEHACEALKLLLSDNDILDMLRGALKNGK